MVWKGDGLAGRMREAALQEIREGLEEIVLPEAQAKCPKDTGLTASSGAVDETKNGVKISFKSDVEVKQGVSLVVWLHENMSYTPRVAGTGPKFLEGPFMANAPEVIARVEARLRTVK